MILRLKKVENKLKKNKDAYIISKLAEGSLKAKDLRDQRELIDAADALIQLQFLAGDRVSKI